MTTSSLPCFYFIVCQEHIRYNKRRFSIRPYILQSTNREAWKLLKNLPSGSLESGSSLKFLREPLNKSTAIPVSRAWKKQNKMEPRTRMQVTSKPHMVMTRPFFPTAERCCRNGIAWRRSICSAAAVNRHSAILHVSV